MKKVMTDRHVIECLQLFIHPHLDSEPLLDQIHLVLSVLGCQVLLLPIGHVIPFIAEVDVKQRLWRCILLLSGLWHRCVYSCEQWVE